MTLKRINEELTYFRRNMYYKTEEFLTSKNCTAFLFFPRAHTSKELLLGKVMDFPADRKMDKMCLDREKELRKASEN